MVPSAAIQDGQNGPQVFVVNSDHTVDQRPVTTGRIVDGRTVVLNGLNLNERVVTNGHLRLVHKTRVELRTVEQAVDAVRRPASPKSEANLQSRPSDSIRTKGS